MIFEVPQELAELRGRVRQFVDGKIIPNEKTIVAEDRAGSQVTLRKLQEEAKAASLYTPHLPRDLGGLALGVMGQCVLFREMGRSLVGPRVFNCDAPDQGNMDLLIAHASEAIKKRWLAPLCKGEITSAFCMTEPAPGAGADPTNLRTRATQTADGWTLDGHKWFATGGGSAAFLLVLARTSDDKRGGATLFCVDRHAKGVEHVRDVATMAEPLLVHREAELRLTQVHLSNEDVIGKVGEGFALAQARLVPARLTHCMRWLGLAARALELCRGYLTSRISFGKPLADHQLVQQKLAANATAIHAGNLMTFHVARLLEKNQTREAKAYSSMAKTHIARALCQTLDDAIQLHGALGYSEDMPFASWYRFARAARIADGPDEVHEVLIAREVLEGRLDLLV